MLDTFDTSSQVGKYSNVQQCDAPALQTTTVLQGAGCLSMAKSGTGDATGIVRRMLSVPIDVEALRVSLREPYVKARLYHTAWTNVTKVFARLVYRFSTAGAAAIYDQFELASPFTNSSWANVLSVKLRTPTSEIGTPQPMHRSMCQAIELGVVMGASGNTISSLFWDALDIEAESGTAQPSVIVIGDDRVMLPPLNYWRRNLDGVRKISEAPEAIEFDFEERKEEITFGFGGVRNVYPSTFPTNAHSLEESLRRVQQYLEENNEFGVAWPAKQLIDTTIGTAAAVGDKSIVVASSRDFAFLGLDGTLETATADIRIGPSDGRNYEVARALAYSGTTIYLDRPVRFAHEVGTPVRSMRYYPNLAMTGEASAVSEEELVRFSVTAKENA